VSDLSQWNQCGYTGHTIYRGSLKTVNENRLIVGGMEWNGKINIIIDITV
jgi:hypothetical protein